MWRTYNDLHCVAIVAITSLNKSPLIYSFVQLLTASQNPKTTHCTCMCVKNEGGKWEAVCILVMATPQTR